MNPMMNTAEVVAATGMTANELSYKMQQGKFPRPTESKRGQGGGNRWPRGMIDSYLADVESGVSKTKVYGEVTKKDPNPAKRARKAKRSHGDDKWRVMIVRMMRSEMRSAISSFTQADDYRGIDPEMMFEFLEELFEESHPDVMKVLKEES